MINFRFHVVAVTAVVSAVVAGLVVGTLALRGPIAAPARASTVAADERGSELQAQVDVLASRLAAGERLATDLAPSLLAGRLASRHVIIVATPTASHEIAGVEAMLTAGGATVSGRVELTDRFLDPARRDDLLDLALASLPPGVPTGLPATAEGVTATAGLLAAVLLRRTPEVPDADVRSVLSAYVSQGYLTGSSGVASPADAVVVLTGTGTADAGASIALLSVGLAAAGPVVAAGGAGDGTAVRRLRSDPAAVRKLSTVDNVSTPQGKLATAWALADQLAGKTGHYGDGPGASSPLPPLTPIASPAPASPTPSPDPAPGP